jgi:hypothetical protein
MAVTGTYPITVPASPRYDESLTLDPSSIPAFANQTESFTVADDANLAGLTTDMKPLVKAPSLESGLFIIGARVSAADTLEIDFQNFTGSPVDPASQTFEVTAF